MGETVYDRDSAKSDRGPTLKSGVVVERQCPNLCYRRVHGTFGTAALPLVLLSVLYVCLLLGGTKLTKIEQNEGEQFCVHIRAPRSSHSGGQ